MAAQVLDRRWRKDQILEAYLNLVPFRSELVGIDALSRTLFGKAAHGLDDREAAVAAALVRAPNARPALVAQRACGVLRDMHASASASPLPRRAKGAAPAAGLPVDCDALEFFTTAALQRRLGEQGPAQDGGPAIAMQDHLAADPHGILHRHQRLLVQPQRHAAIAE